MIASTQTNSPLSNSGNAVLSAGEALDQACSRLKSAGLRITQPRIAILSAMIARSEPATIEQVHTDLKDRSCDLVTVYRCLASFEELGLVRRCFFLNGTSLYQIQLGNQPVYHVMSKAGAILDTVSAELSAELQAVLAKIENELKGRGYSEVTNMAAFFATAASTSRIPADVTAKL